ncbi:MAG: hypothetical protein CM15mP91_0960 [Chloroflexota bacterium]|nr:MAG: hypothetical protein CM15mP91_0960 [Chloroflexota bacterium]
MISSQSTIQVSITDSSNQIMFNMENIQVVHN